ncbi:hypothetical protein M408DRAFT_144613 [Serendipita vermifera MAFF 305830]|uniref:Uncharacterized protein n=1 Tax=Serendipita vermifera MAFF 305830 TaxID=933852 RepID=A0A0C3AUI5_SERVB|nr:hypothetical protein M408DRAFT_144613 [Serendipita vermifera MAFF 305830]
MYISSAIWTIVACLSSFLRFFSIFFLNFFPTVAIGETYGMKQEDLHNLIKRQSSTTYQQCTNTCNSYSTLSSQCSSLIATSMTAYSTCFCSGAVASAVVECINCGIGIAASQSDIDLVAYVVNTYSNACNTLGTPITIAITTQPAVNFPCSLNFSTGNGVAPTTAPPLITIPTLTSATPTPTVTTATPTGIAIPTDFSIDPSQLSLLSSLLGGISAAV